MDFFEIDREFLEKGIILAGADEAGRGPLAGPVVAAAVIMGDEFIDGINDSKKLSEKKRDALYEEIISRAKAWSVGVATVAEIEEMNILNAARLAFKRAVEGLEIAPEFVYCDYITGLTLPCEHEIMVKGDANVYSIAAASIVAKVTRDRMMLSLAEKYPEYAFEKHKGYGTKVHKEALLKYGPCPEHRPSFLKKILGGGNA